ncbi:MAG TPA: hypothetical protein PKY10_04675 [Lentisphaeria bacterium]|nr:hypothetical protein [Lentisphaeria bacterium]
MHKNFLLATLCLGAALTLVGCVTYLKPDDPRVIEAKLRLQTDINNLEAINKKTQQEINDNNNKTAYFKNKISVVEKEKDDSKDSIRETRQQIKRFFTNLMQVSVDSEDQLFDCLIGNAPIERKKVTNETRQSLLLVDCRNIVDVDSLLFCGGELYSRTAVEAQFCILRQSPQSSNSFIIETVSDPFKLPAGYSNVLFPRNKRLSARRGNLIGLYIKPNNKICYDDFGTGKGEEIPLKNIIPRETTIRLTSTPGLPPSSNKPIDKAYSFRLYGSSYLQ